MPHGQDSEERTCVYEHFCLYMFWCVRTCRCVSVHAWVGMPVRVAEMYPYAGAMIYGCYKQHNPVEGR